MHIVSMAVEFGYVLFETHEDFTEEIDKSRPILVLHFNA